MILLFSFEERIIGYFSWMRVLRISCYFNEVVTLALPWEYKGSGVTLVSLAPPRTDQSGSGAAFCSTVWVCAMAVSNSGIKQPRSITSKIQACIILSDKMLWHQNVFQRTLLYCLFFFFFFAYFLNWRETLTKPETWASWIWGCNPAVYRPELAQSCV